ncbi:MAG: 2-oxoacid:acceptor oxidoreductase family protein [Candidatus Omnitrophota bacterium]
MNSKKPAGNAVNEAVICAGFGGQGIMTLGKVLAHAGMMNGFNVTWLPCYGAEVRGGTAHAMVRISSAPVISPMIYKPDTVIIMNGPSLDKFEGELSSGGLLILNSSMAARKPERKDIEVISAPFTEEAIKTGNVKVANMIAAAVFAVKKNICDKEILFEVIKKMAGDRKSIIDINIKAVERGFDLAV